MQPAKQKRSQERVEKILAVADQILCSGSISDITIANVSKVSELKRTSTYKFLKLMLDRNVNFECDNYHLVHINL